MTQKDTLKAHQLREDLIGQRIKFEPRTEGRLTLIEQRQIEDPPFEIPEGLPVPYTTTGRHISTGFTTHVVVEDVAQRNGEPLHAWFVADVDIELLP